MTPPRHFITALPRRESVRQAVPVLRFALLFLGVFVLLQWAYPALAGTAVYRFYLETMTVRPSAALIQWIAPHDGVLARGHRLIWSGG